MKTRIITLFFYSLLLFVGACQTKNETVETEKNKTATENNVVTLSNEQVQSIGLTTTQLHQTDLEKTIKINGKVVLSPNHLVSVSSILGGHVKNIHVLVGASFKKGQVLAVVEDQQFVQLQQDYLVTKAQLESARLNYERQKELNTNKATSDKTFQMAEADYRTLTATKRALEEKLKMIHIQPQNITANSIRSSVNVYAPFNGTVSKVLVNKGQYITPSDALFELIDPSGLMLDLNVYEKDVQALAIGQELMVYTNQNPKKKQKAKIVSIVPNINEDGAAQVMATLNERNSEMISGLYVNADVYLKNYKANVLPDESVVTFENKSYVFEDLGNNRYAMILIQIGTEANELVEVLNPEKIENKKIVLKGAYSLLMALKNTAEE